MNLERQINLIGKYAKEASYELGLLSNKKKNECLIAASKNIKIKQATILEANKKDMLNAKKRKLTPALIDRLKLDRNRINSICKGLLEITKLKDPVGQVLSSWKRPNGLKIEKVSVPLGVIGVIYESRPNVAADAAALCLKSSNATILRGGSESFHSSSIIIDTINETYKKMGLPKGALQKIPTTNRDAVGYFLKLDKYIDVFVPRGGRSLIERVIKESRVPVFKHLDGICHTYIHKSANKELASNIVVNAKMRRPGICGATETLLIDKDAVESHLPLIIKELKNLKCELRVDKYILNFDKTLKKAIKKDWETEYLDSILSIKTIEGGVKEAIEHINNFGSGHTDSIIAEDKKLVELFLNKVDSGIVMHNTSTQFADGGEFGMGAEIGISTSKLHARGPVGVSQLTSFKYKVKGNGQIRK
ncbi:MAG: glutamate-5-semialdehyde dehydrogenase [Rickettsiales bacterium]|nr:glutamate-5-semialdehyde dehydrogenase [Rickettsiales bacterium]|tara:strand:+ start:515 stop:1774 length:1260 start_codon:yes stop_codon:yes gene_type:complete